MCFIHAPFKKYTKYYIVKGIYWTSVNLHKHFYTTEFQIVILLQQFWQKDVWLQ